jgi:hypothetical protein
MDEHELYDCVIKRMKIFNISFEDAIKEIKEMYPIYEGILDKFVDPSKTQIEMTYQLWHEIETLMDIVSSRKSTEEQIQRQLGVVSFLYNREFDRVLW